VKSEDAIRSRLRKLRGRYLRKYVSSSQERRHENCVHNQKMTPLNRDPQVMTELEMAPRVSSSIIVIQPDFPVRLCVHGIDDPSSWNGDLCDSDDVARSCKNFTPRVTSDQAETEFKSLLEDDAYVLENYKDIAALQWVLDERVHMISPSLLERVLLWVTTSFSRVPKRNGSPEVPALPEEIWDDTDEAPRE